MLSDDEKNLDSPDFVPNPANSTVKHNIIVNLFGDEGNFSEKACLFSDIGENCVNKFKDGKAVFEDFENGDYRMADVSFDKLPLSEIGRY